jgi:hypothetical protein
MWRYRKSTAAQLSLSPPNGTNSRQSKAINQHLHSERRPPTRDTECDIRTSKAVHGFNCTRRKHFIFCDHRAVDIGDEQANIG